MEHWLEVAQFMAVTDPAWNILIELYNTALPGERHRFTYTPAQFTAYQQGVSNASIVA